MRIIRVFLQKTSMTPTDKLAVIRRMPGFCDQADEIHISVVFTWDLPMAERLAKEWKHVAPVKIGGPALNEPGGDFIPGMYLKQGHIITSRGCPNRCWFCSVWKREGGRLRELPIYPGWNILDDNLLACSDDHIRAVFDMAKTQKRKGGGVEFTGGFEAARLKKWHVEELRKIKPSSVFFAYDREQEYPALKEAGKILIEGGFTASSHILRCFVLCGYEGDTKEKALHRMEQVIETGMTPMAMLWTRDDGWKDPDWIGDRFVRKWARPCITHRPKKEGKPGLIGFGFK